MEGKPTIQETVRQYITQELKPNLGYELADDTTLISGGVIDSITTLQLVDFIEGEFGIEFEAHEVDRDNLDTLGRIAAFVESKQ